MATKMCTKALLVFLFLSLSACSAETVASNTAVSSEEESSRSETAESSSPVKSSTVNIAKDEAVRTHQTSKDEPLGSIKHFHTEDPKPADHPNEKASIKEDSVLSKDENKELHSRVERVTNSRRDRAMEKPSDSNPHGTDKTTPTAVASTGTPKKPPSLTSTDVHAADTAKKGETGGDGGGGVVHKKVSQTLVREDHSKTVSSAETEHTAPQSLLRKDQRIEAKQEKKNVLSTLTDDFHGNAGSDRPRHIPRGGGGGGGRETVDLNSKSSDTNAESNVRKEEVKGRDKVDGEPLQNPLGERSNDRAEPSPHPTEVKIVPSSPLPMDSFFPAASPLRSREELSKMYHQVIHTLYTSANLTAAVEAIHEGASFGHGRLHWLLGVLYSNGIGVPQSDAKALLHHTFAALESVPEAHMVLGHRYAEGLGVEKNCEIAVAHLREAADAVAMTYDGVLRSMDHHTRDMVGQRSAAESEKAMYVLMYRADDGSVDALLSLGYIYFKGHNGVPRNWHRAQDYFLSALEKGEAMAYGALGQLYATGDLHADPPIPRDYEKAALYFKQGAVKKDAVSLNGMGYLHATGHYEADEPRPEGESRRPDFERAATYFAESVSRGSVEGMYNLGVLHLHGRGVPLDVHLAMKHFEGAASRGSVLSFWQLARHEQAKGNCARAMQLYAHVTSFASIFDRTPGVPYFPHDGGDTTATMRSESSLVRLLELLALGETGHLPSRWAAAQLLDEDVHIVEETAEELTADKVFAVSGKPPQDALRGTNVVWLHWERTPTASRKQLNESGNSNRRGAGDGANGDIKEDSVNHGGTRKGSKSGDLVRPHLLSQAEARKMLQLRLYELCALSGKTDANLRLGDFYYYGESELFGVSMPRALLYYEAAALKGSTKALFSMGFMYQMGLGVSAHTETESFGEAFLRILRNKPLNEREATNDTYTEEMRLHLAKRYYDHVLEVDPSASYYAVRFALMSLNFQWWWMHFSRMPYGLSNFFRLPMPLLRENGHGVAAGSAHSTIETADTSQPKESSSQQEQQSHGQMAHAPETPHDDSNNESFFDFFVSVPFDDLILMTTGTALFLLLLIRHHGA